MSDSTPTSGPAGAQAARKPYKGTFPPAGEAVSRLLPRPASTDARDFGISELLGLPDAAGPLEVYIGWPTNPVPVSARGLHGQQETWGAAAPLLRERVIAAVRPLEAAGWLIDGPFAAAARWDMSQGTGRDLYEGCWVRMRRRDG